MRKKPQKYHCFFALANSSWIWACTGVWLVYSVRLHYRKVGCFLSQWISVVDSFLLRLGAHIYFPFSVLGLCLA